MTKEEIITALKELNKQDVTPDAITEGKKLLDAYQLAVLHRQQNLKEAFEAEGNNPADFVVEREELDTEFDSQWAEFSKHKKEFKEKKQDEEKTNLEAKRTLLNEISELKNEEHIKKAHEAFKAIEEKWKALGRIPQDKIKEIDNAYSVARDEFFYNMHIYRELLENDLKKNLQLKEEIVAKMKDALNFTSFKDMDSAARRLTKEWNEIGPTYKEKWEAIRDEFWEAHHAIFNKIKDFYKTQKEKQVENLEKKTALVNRLKEILSHNIQTEKSWNKHTKFVIDLQKEWKTIGFAPKADNERIWQEFKEQADSFFNKKSEFFLALKQTYDANKKIKDELVAQAEELINSDHLKQTAKKLTELQHKWRETGSAHHRDEQKLWKKFRAACNSFFENKKNKETKASAEHIENLEKKNALLKSIDTLEVNKGNQTQMDALVALINEFNAIGYVPIKDKQTIANTFKRAVQKKLSAAGLDTNDVYDFLFELKLKEISGSQNPQVGYEKEINALREKIKTTKSNILQYENNLGFFKHAKGNNPMLMEVETKIADGKKLIANLENKLAKVFKQYNN